MMRKIEAEDMLKKYGLATQENIENLAKIFEYSDQANVTLTEEYKDIITKNPGLIQYISAALPYVVKYEPTKKYVDLLFKYASTDHEDSYVLPRGFRALNDAKLLDTQTAELICKRPQIGKLLKQLFTPSPENLLTKDNVMVMLENDMISNNYEKLITIFSILGADSKILTQSNFDRIIETLDNIDELALALKKYELTAFDYFTECWNSPQISQEEFNAIMTPIHEKLAPKREQEIRAALSKTEDSAAISTQRFFAKPDSRIIPENGIVDIICQYSR